MKSASELVQSGSSVQFNRMRSRSGNRVQNTLQLTIEDRDLSAFNFDDLTFFQSTFVNCFFPKTQRLRFLGCKLINCTFVSGRLPAHIEAGNNQLHVAFHECRLDNTKFVKADFQDVRFVRSKIKRVVFDRCSFSGIFYLGHCRNIEAIKFEGDSIAHSETYRESIEGSQFQIWRWLNWNNIDFINKIPLVNISYFVLLIFLFVFPLYRRIVEGLISAGSKAVEELTDQKFEDFFAALRDGALPNLSLDYVILFLTTAGLFVATLLHNFCAPDAKLKFQGGSVHVPSGLEEISVNGNRPVLAFVLSVSYAVFALALLGLYGLRISAGF